MKGNSGIQGGKGARVHGTPPKEGPVELKNPVQEANLDAPLAEGLSHQKVTPDPARTTQAFDVKRRAEFLRHEQGKEPMTVEAYAVLTGIQVDAAEAQRLDKLVKDTAKKLGIDHMVGFGLESDFMGLYAVPFLGTFRPQDRPEQPILVGVGLKATRPEDVDLLYRFFRDGPFPKALVPWLDDFLKLDEPQRIEAILVHEKLELDAIGRCRHPHHTAVAEAPKTSYRISPRVRAHLELYARLNREAFGGPA